MPPPTATADRTSDVFIEPLLGTIIIGFDIFFCDNNHNIGKNQIDAAEIAWLEAKENNSLRVYVS